MAYPIFANIEESVEMVTNFMDSAKSVQISNVGNTTSDKVKIGEAFESGALIPFDGQHHQNSQETHNAVFS